MPLLITIVAGHLAWGFWIFLDSKAGSKVVHKANLRLYGRITAIALAAVVIGFSWGVKFAPGDATPTTEANPNQADLASNADNRYVCVTGIDTPLKGEGQYGLLFEFGVFDKPSNGFVGAIALSEYYSHADHWFGTPLRTHKQVSDTSYTLLTTSTPKGPSTYQESFRAPNVTTRESYYIYFEGTLGLSSNDVSYLDDWRTVFNRPSDIVEMQKKYEQCPR